ncbi:28948_t:CDS:1, partial [Racocetra persica]
MENSFLLRKTQKEYEQSDEYSDSADEIDEQEFDNAIISMLRKNNS